MGIPWANDGIRPGFAGNASSADVFLGKAGKFGASPDADTDSREIPIFSKEIPRISETPAAILTANLAERPEQEEMIMDRRDVPSLLVIAVLMLAFAGIACEGTLPTAPPPPAPREPSTPPPSTRGSVYGMVLAPNGACLPGATVEMVDGPRAGERVTQTAGDCEELYDMSVYAFIFKDLPQGTPVTLRASMEGYESLTLSCPVMDCCFHYWSSSVEFRLTPRP